MGWVDPRVGLLGWVGLGRDFAVFDGLCWVTQLMGWVGSCHGKWTHGQLWLYPSVSHETHFIFKFGTPYYLWNG